MEARTAFEIILRRILLWIVSYGFVWSSYRSGAKFDPPTQQLVFHAIASIVGWSVIAWMVW
jgi:hypothetical protein